MSIVSNTSDASLESAPIRGLSTPQVNNGEFNDDTFSDAQNSLPTATRNNGNDDADTFVNNGKVSSVFDIAQEIEQRLHVILQNVENTDKDTNERIDNIVARLSALEKKVSQHN